MAKVILTPIGSFSQSAINTLNANFDRITTALESLLSRDGTAPNQMTADLDMNSQDVLNGGTGYFSELWIDGNNWPGEPPEFIEGPEGPAGQGWGTVFGIVTDGSRRVLQVIGYVGGDGDAPTDNIGDYVGAAGYVTDIASAVDVRGPQGPQGTAGAGTGDMLAADYDPNGVTADAFSMGNMVETSTKKILTDVERTKLTSVETNADVTDATNVDAAGAVMNSDTSISSMQFVLNEAALTSNSATKVPTQSSVKSYVDNKFSARTESIIIAVSDETTALTTGTAKVTFRMPYALTLTAVRGSLTTAQTSGSILTVDINETGSTILSTKLTIDNSEKTSTTAATAAVVSDANLADNAEITIDIDQVGNGTAAGLKITLIGTRP